jgi:hypothetical protein
LENGAPNVKSQARTRRHLRKEERLWRAFLLGSGAADKFAGMPVRKSTK